MSISQAIAREFLGISVFISNDMTCSHFVHPSIPSRLEGMKDSDDGQEVAIVLPDESVILTLCIDAVGGVYIYTALCPGQMFLVKASWRCVADIFDPDSIVHGIAYHNRDGEMTIGIFDASRLAGRDIRGMQVLERHIHVHGVLHRKPLPPHVQYHWAGFAHCCWTHIDRDTNPFPAHQMLVLGGDGTNRRVLGPLLTGPSSGPMTPDTRHDSDIAHQKHPRKTHGLIEQGLKL